MSAAWFKRDVFDLAKTDNLLISPSDYVPFQVANPLTGETLTIYNLNRSKLGQSDIFDTTATDRDLNRRGYTGIETTFNVRLPGGTGIFGGYWSDKNIVVACDGDDPNTFLYCDQSTLDIPFQHNFKLAGSAPLPYGVHARCQRAELWRRCERSEYRLSDRFRADGELGGSGQPVPRRPNAVGDGAADSPGEKYLDRWTQVDLSLKKIFSFGNQRIEGALDMFNFLNSNVVLTQNQSFGPQLDQPSSILQPRLLRVSAQWKF